MAYDRQVGLFCPKEEFMLYYFGYPADVSAVRIDGRL